jgi:hypothetical protein
MRMLLCRFFFLVAACTVCADAFAAVERIDITERRVVANGDAFGAAGAYEKIRGSVSFALDPDLAANVGVVDLKLAPRDETGRVRFTADFLMLRPADPARGNGTLLYEVNNRGNLAMLGQLDEARYGNDPSERDDFGNAFLLRQGFTLLWSAWTWDVAAPPGEHRLILAPPLAREGGGPITGKVAYEIIVPAATPVAAFTGIQGKAYPFADDGAPDAVLTIRERPEAERRVVPRARWSFLAPGYDGLPQQLKLEGGFEPGHLYELTYRARDPVVVGVGMTGIRDLLSYLGSHAFADAPPPARRLVFGISQSGRLIETMLLQGFSVDEDGKATFEGAFIHVAGAGKGSFNHRFAMPTRHFSMLEDHGYPTDYFPFTTTPERDPITGAEASVLDLPRRHEPVPKLFYVNNSSEYWNRAASLIHTDPEGKRDWAIAPEARVYLIAGAQHYIGRQRNRGIFANCVNPLNHYRVMRALLMALDRWVRDGTEPPPSTYPRLGDGTLVTVESYKDAFPRIAGIALPESNLRPPRLDVGPRFASIGTIDVVPPRLSLPFETRVPKPNSDGLDQGGIALPEMTVPLGTRTGFNTRNEAAGFSWATGRWDGSFVPFARTEAERHVAGDPRPSLQARYRDRGDYVTKVAAAARQVVVAGFLQTEEAGPLVAEAGRLYDRIMSHEPADRSCDYLVGP